MAIKASNQVTLIDLTDAYSVILTNEAHTFIGDTDSVSSQQSTTTQVYAYCGSQQVPASVGTISAPTGLSFSSDGKTPAPTVTITATTALKTGGTVDIPIIITAANGDTISITKKFSYSIAFTGAKGATGNTGADAITVTVTSSNGLIFKNTDIATTLTAHVYRGGTEITGTALSSLGSIKWYKDGGTTAVATGTTLSISAGDIDNKASYVAQLEG